MFKGKPYRKDAFASLYPINWWKAWDLMALVELFRKCCFQSSFVHTELTVRESGWEEPANLSRVMRGGHWRVRVDYRGRNGQTPQQCLLISTATIPFLTASPFVLRYLQISLFMATFGAFQETKNT